MNRETASRPSEPVTCPQCGNELDLPPPSWVPGDEVTSPETPELSVPRGADQLALSEQVAIDEVMNLLPDSDARQFAVQSIKNSYQRKADRMRPIQPRKRRSLLPD